MYEQEFPNWEVFHVSCFLFLVSGGVFNSSLPLMVSQEVHSLLIEVLCLIFYERYDQELSYGSCVLAKLLPR